MIHKASEAHNAGGSQGMVVPSDCIRWDGEPARVHVPGQSAAEPRIDLVREGNIIRAIDVTCTCGKRVRLKCVYPESR